MATSKARGEETNIWFLYCLTNEIVYFAVHGSNNFTCVIHYGGDFVMSPRMKYTSKRVANFDFVDVDTFSTFTLCEMVEKLIVDAPFAVYWRVPNAALSTASVKPLKTDHDCIAMMNSLPDNRHIHIYMKPVRVVADEEVNEDLEDLNEEEEIYEADHDDEEEVNEDEIHGAATGQEEAYVNEEEAEVYEDEEIHVDANEEDVAATATEEEKEEVNVATTEEEGDAATEEEEEGDTATEEEVDVAEEEEDSEATEEFDVSDHEYDWAGDEECRQDDGIGFRVQRNMDGFGPDGVNLNEKDKEPESETDNSEDLYSDHGSDSDRPRKWDLTGIPCSHAASVFRLNNLRPEHFVNECYHNSTQLAIYSNMITPIKVTDMEPILPPIIRRPPGRPTKKRRLEPDEITKPKLSRRGMQANCTKCGKQGYNRRTCRGEVGANQPIRRPTLICSKPRQPQQPQQPPVPRREKIPIRTKQHVPPPKNVRWMPSQESNISNPPTQESQSTTRE
ncbi:hypothetical protein V6N12_019279 [Hibiscus sabdariffa]|uniref:Zinc finger PMZ-type domain-containing protein n=1 Tax=Hibiscus sabdariffa TaxID=183260 RepID=A0ABR2ATD2_9ROSI